jgi:hypothetical protein
MLYSSSAESLEASSAPDASPVAWAPPGWDVILSKFSLSCSGSAWFGLPQAVNNIAVKAAARSVSLIIQFPLK